MKKQEKLHKALIAIITSINNLLCSSMVGLNCSIFVKQVLNLVVNGSGFGFSVIVAVQVAKGINLKYRSISTL